MKIHTHRLMRDDGHAAEYVASPHVGGAIAPRFLVIHYTAGSSAAGTISWFSHPASRVSAHLVIGRDGAVTQMVPFNHEAWHAGQSRWGSVSGLNRHSIGIELDNAGRLIRSGGNWVSPLTRRIFPDSEVTVAPHKNDPPGTPPCGWHAYTPQQIEAALECGTALVKHYRLADVLGHDDIAPGRKCDPARTSPWNRSVRACWGVATTIPSAIAPPPDSMCAAAPDPTFRPCRAPPCHLAARSRYWPNRACGGRSTRSARSTA
jgi:N-acetylmuramoyl-L-alanine amidase